MKTFEHLVLGGSVEIHSYLGCCPLLVLQISRVRGMLGVIPGRDEGLESSAQVACSFYVDFELHTH